MEDIWHFPRKELTDQLTKAIQYNIIHSFTLFAPRRIGKTYFLNSDLKPALESLGYKTIYFSFADQLGNPLEEFKKTIIQNIDRSLFSKLNIKELNFSWCKISLEKNIDFSSLSILELISILAHGSERSNSKAIFMLDEIQELINVKDADGFIGELRTALDLNKNFIKVIFTGSSRDGLRKMFSDRKAPFFHFGTNLKMEPFGREFTDFLCDKYKYITGVALARDEFYDIFKDLNFVTLSIREFLSFYIMSSNTSLTDAYKNFEQDVFDKKSYVFYWRSLIPAEKAILLGLLSEIHNFYSEKFYSFILEKYQLALSQGKIQNALNKLLRNGDIHQNDDGEYEIEDLFMKRWMLHRIDQISNL